MQPVQITIRDMPVSTALQGHLLKKVSRLDHLYNRIQHCRIVIDVPQKHKRNGNMFRVCIDLRVPGKDLIVNKKHDEDVYVAVRDAFLAAERKLETYVGKIRGDVKTHDGIDFGYVKRLFPEEGYGFILSAEGLEYYFSLTNVAYPHFSQLEIGDIVHFIGMPASEGWQAHRVTKKCNTH
jgi:ribosomal subunit interface protein